jgi:hypothetical protein
MGSSDTPSWPAPQQYQERSTSLEPTTLCCSNLAGPARGQVGPGHSGIHARQEQRCIWTPCHTTVAATTGPVVYRRRPAADLVVTGVTRLAHGGPLPALVAAFRLDERTGAAWWARAGQQGQAVQESVVEPPRELGQGHADASRVKTPGDIGWMALARMVRTRWWRAGEVRVPRDMPLRRRLSERVRRGAAPRPRVCCPAGLCSSRRALRQPCRDPGPTGRQGRPRWRRWRHRGVAPVVTR